jgi:hypothetical protein
VILVVAILVSVPVFVTQATVAPSWKVAYKNQANYIDVLTMQNAHVQLALKQANALAEKRLVALNDLRTAMNLAVSKLEVELRSQKSINAKQGNDLANLSVNLTELEKTLKREVERVVFYQKALETLRTEYDTLKSASIRTEDSLRQVQAENQRLGKVVKLLREQLAEANERNKELEVLLAAGGGAKKRAKVEDVPKIDGTITTVRGDLAGINIGSAKGVKSGMQLVIYRGSQFVAHLRVQEVGIDESAGTVFDKYQGMQPIKGDKVTTSLKR